MDDHITSVSELLSVIVETGLTDQVHSHVRVWFRGQANKQWRLLPGVYRDGFAPDETRRVLKERHLTQDFLTMSAPLRKFESDSEAYFVQQHYRMPTRLLDWSLSPLAALFFALDGDADGSVVALDAYRFRADPPDRGLCTPRSTELTNAMKAIFDWDDRDRWSRYILPVMPTNIDPRIAAQRGCFTFHPPADPELTSVGNGSLVKWIVPQAAKADLRRELGILGVDEFTIYGDLDRLAERLKRAYQ